MEVAKFKHVDPRDYMQWETVGGKAMEKFPDYVRVSEYVEVNFPARPAEELVQTQLAALAIAEHELMEKFNVAMNSIESRRAELRALTYQAQS